MSCLEGQFCSPLLAARLPQARLFLLQSGEAGAKLVERARQVAILGVAVEVEALCPLALQQRQLDVVGQQEELARLGHDERLRATGGPWTRGRMGEGEMTHRYECLIDDVVVHGLGVCWSHA